MWLINTETYRLKSFSGQKIPPYAILSHCWGDDEVSFLYFRNAQMVEDPTNFSVEEERAIPMLSELRLLRQQKLESLKGWEKVLRLCEISRARKLSWAWIDTACIDKSSSAELQEAINSMYKWYRDAEICFVYMQDVSRSALNEFRNSRWFTRGWTLQELIAPGINKMTFLDSNWKALHFESDIIHHVSSITGIGPLILQKKSNLIQKLLISQCSIAEKMSWASKRQVTRGEDAAYCLLGIFGVNIPLLYGEGEEKAFERLQLEIIKVSTDETILAWNNIDAPKISTALALSPKDFAFSASHRANPIHMSNRLRHTPIQAGQRGIIMDTILIDRNQKNVLSRLVSTLNTFKADFAIPLMCSSVDPKFNTILVQLRHVLGNLYQRLGPTIGINLDKELLASCLNMSVQVCILYNHSDRLLL